MEQLLKRQERSVGGPGLAANSSTNRLSKNILIHVRDAGRKTQTDFSLDKEMLLTNMKYFDEYLPNASGSDIEVSIHCDVVIFEWLIAYMRDAQKQVGKLTVNDAVPILISSDFLRMQGLVEDCLAFVHKNINPILRLPLDLSCLSDELVKALANRFSAKELDLVRDRRNRLLSRLYFHKLMELLDENATSCLQQCVHCRRLFTLKQQELTSCPALALGGGELQQQCDVTSFKGALASGAPPLPSSSGDEQQQQPQPQQLFGSFAAGAQRQLDFHGQPVVKHVPDPGWECRSHLRQCYHRSQKEKVQLPWREIYWRMWGHLQTLHCRKCNSFFSAVELLHCEFHPQAPCWPGATSSPSQPQPQSTGGVMSLLPHEGWYACCGKLTSRFPGMPASVQAGGCCAREHEVDEIWHADALVMEKVAGHQVESTRTSSIWDALQQHKALVCVPYSHASSMDTLDLMATGASSSSGSGKQQKQKQQAATLLAASGGKSEDDDSSPLNDTVREEAGGCWPPSGQPSWSWHGRTYCFEPPPDHEQVGGRDIIRMEGEEQDAGHWSGVKGLGCWPAPCRAGTGSFHCKDFLPGTSNQARKLDRQLDVLKEDDRRRMHLLNDILWKCHAASKKASSPSQRKRSTKGVTLAATASQTLSTQPSASRPQRAGGSAGAANSAGRPQSANANERRPQPLLSHAVSGKRPPLRA